ncbi:hypothetical protein EH183_09795 [Streptomyces sp. CB01881]|nr:hypothetical protein C2142_09785 [Streptomyces sp. CB01881]TYC77672.1 hypothetical protein EH183_09795 [Streptomyces sp. CB01881]
MTWITGTFRSRSHFRPSSSLWRFACIRSACPRVRPRLCQSRATRARNSRPNHPRWGSPHADAGRVGEAGPGPSYLDEGSGGIPAEGNRRSERDAGCRFDFENPNTAEPSASSDR